MEDRRRIDLSKLLFDVFTVACVYTFAAAAYAQWYMGLKYGYKGNILDLYEINDLVYLFSFHFTPAVVAGVSLEFFVVLKLGDTWLKGRIRRHNLWAAAGVGLLWILEILLGDLKFSLSDLATRLTIMHFPTFTYLVGFFFALALVPVNLAIDQSELVQAGHYIRTILLAFCGFLIIIALAMSSKSEVFSYGSQKCVVSLADGSQISGTFLNGRPESVIIAVGNTITEFNRETVKRIELNR